MKLGFVLKITNEGVPGETFSINKDENWARYTEDVRTPIKELVGFDGTEKVVYLIKFLGNIGYLICVIKARPEGSGRTNDNTAAWIFIPANVCISSEETVRVLKIVEEAISGKKGINREQLEVLFDQEYDTNDVLISAVGTICFKNDSTYKVRYFNGDFTIYELLGNNIAQQEYGQYKGILLIDKTTGIKHSSNSELNFEPLQICRYDPFPHIDEFTPCFSYHGQYRPFDKSIEVPLGKTITIYWVKNGYSEIKKSFEAELNSKFPETAKINKKEYKIKISKDLFNVKDSDGVPLSHFDVRINQQLMTGDFLEVYEESYLQGLTISISSSGYKESKQSNVHLSLNQKVIVTLSKQLFHYEFAIPVHDEENDLNNDAIVVVETYKKINTSPIKGYINLDGRIQEGEGHVNRLSWDDRLLNKIKYAAYGFVACIIILLSYSTCEKYELVFDWPPIKEIKQTPKDGWWTGGEKLEDVGQLNTDSIKAINYLETNDIWHKDSLDNIEATKGLFEELNSFKLDALQKRKGGVLKGSSKLCNVIEKLSDYINEGKNPHHGKEKSSGNYNSISDKGINVENYLIWLSEEHEPVDIMSSNNPPTEHRNHITGGSRNIGTNDGKKVGDNQSSSNPNGQNGSSARGGVK